MHVHSRGSDKYYIIGDQALTDELKNVKKQAVVWKFLVLVLFLIFISTVVFFYFSEKILLIQLSLWVFATSLVLLTVVWWIWLINKLNSLFDLISHIQTNFNQLREEISNFRKDLDKK